ncbi:DUF5714 domain-containing protein [Dehalobacterium formicoaceticum]|uniref:DUF5714 domain-containing protein n=1 Tax=Dehalobacterium formicoaceticum TaxID=51515 RepID=A0ABT1Y1K5_9FIRM|nr:DUF5714 domain-containing protein [Dehalobacterium formicoaceticum]MCR6544075.1 DUF5714 domain-containing protein [Dehalobacterium formicoaceticum]
MDMKEYDKYYQMVTDVCTSYFIETNDGDLISLLMQLMDIDGLPMHCPVHHYIVPAALLTVCRYKQGRDITILERDLEEALSRAHNVLGGFCGYYGACGAAVGLGIFLSIMTNSSPLSRKPWGYLNRATGQALLDMAELGGPRCCKRTSFTAIKSVLPQINEVLRLDIQIKEPIVCHYHENNNECQKQRCPYWPTDREKYECKITDDL